MVRHTSFRTVAVGIVTTATGFAVGERREIASNSKYNKEIRNLQPKRRVGSANETD